MTRIRSGAAHGALALLVAALLGAAAPVNSHDDHGHGGEIVRIIARLQQDGDIEFGLRTADGDQFPRRRIFSSSISDERWKRSTPVALDNGAAVRIIARRAGDARVEFALRTDEPLQEFLPTRRLFSRSTPVGAWRVSSPLLIPAPPDAEADDHTRADAADPQAEPPNETDGGSTPGQEPGQDDPRETIVGGHRDGLVVERNVIGDPDAPVLIVEYGDPF